MTRSRVAALIAAIACVVVLSMTIKLRGWSAYDLPARAKASMRAAQADRPVEFPDKPGLRTATYRAGRRDLRVVCGWLTSDDPTFPVGRPRFFYVLYQLRLAWVSTEATFLQSRPDEVSPGWGETWCRAQSIDGKK